MQSAEAGSALMLKFPENREFNREFLRIRDHFSLAGTNFISYFNGLSANSLLCAKPGFLSQFQCVAGKFPVLCGTGNFFAGNREFFAGNREFREFTYADRFHGNDLPGGGGNASVPTPSSRAIPAWRHRRTFTDRHA
jgi:hypothetical protein